MSETSEALLAQHKKAKQEIVKKLETIALNADAEQDYEKTRESLHGLLVRSDDILDDLILLARDSEHPRTYEVLCDFIRTKADLGVRLMDLQKKRHELDELNKDEKPKSQQPGDTHIYIGSTSDLQRMMKEANQKEAIEAEYEE